MRILFLCHRVPYPPNKGEKIRAFHQLKALGARHEVHLFTLADDPEDLRHRSELLKYCREVTIVPMNPAWGRLKSLPYLLSRQALSIPYFYSIDLQAAVNRSTRASQYDVIFVYCSAMAQYVAAVGDIPVIVDLVDVDSDKWTQYASHASFPWSMVYRREGRRLREYEKGVAARSAALLVSTGREAALLREIGTSPVHVIPNGVDTEYFQPTENTRVASNPTVIFTGDMAYFPNQQAVEFFAKSVLPLVRQRVPDTRFLIVGRNPNRQVIGLGSLPGVEVTGSVPDVRPYLKQADVAVAPFMIAAGIQNKILEAMSSGIPVVATKRAVQGLSPGAQSLIETGETPQELAEKTSNLLMNQETSRLLGIRGRELVTAEYSWTAALDRLLEVLERPARQTGTVGELFQGLGT